MVPSRATTNDAGDRRRARSARVRIGYGRVSIRDQHLDLERRSNDSERSALVYRHSRRVAVPILRWGSARRRAQTSRRAPCKAEPLKLILKQAIPGVRGRFTDRDRPGEASARLW